MGKKISSNQKIKSKIKNLTEVEFSVFSQWGDDGIIDCFVKIFQLKIEFLLKSELKIIENQIQDFFL